MIKLERKVWTIYKFFVSGVFLLELSFSNLTLLKKAYVGYPSPKSSDFRTKAVFCISLQGLVLHEWWFEQFDLIHHIPIKVFKC